MNLAAKLVDQLLEGYPVEHLFSTKDDTSRVRVFKHEGTNEWNYDIFYRDGRPVYTLASEEGELARTHHEARRMAEQHLGELVKKIRLPDDAETYSHGWETT